MDVNLISQLDNIFTKGYGIPKYIWLPIAMNESGLNPKAHALTSREDSRGLFQINVNAHPQFKNNSLYNPTVNAKIAAAYFLAPAYKAAKKITSDPKKQALIVYSGLKNPDNPKEGYVSGGIRPQWTTATRNRFLGNYAKATGGTTPVVGTAGTPGGGGGGGGMETTPAVGSISGATPAILYRVGAVVLLIIVAIVFIMALLKQGGKI